MYDHGPFIYTINIINPLVKSMIFNYELRKGDYIINQLYTLTREQIEEYAHIYKRRRIAWHINLLNLHILLTYIFIPYIIFLINFFLVASTSKESTFYVLIFNNLTFILFIFNFYNMLILIYLHCIHCILFYYLLN